jgi:hypothetical protein
MILNTSLPNDRQPCRGRREPRGDCSVMNASTHLSWSDFGRGERIPASHHAQPGVRLPGMPRRHAFDQTHARRLAQGGRGHALHGERSSYTVLPAERRLWGSTDGTMPGAGDPAMAMNNPDLGLVERLLRGDVEARSAFEQRISSSITAACAVRSVDGRSAREAEHDIWTAFRAENFSWLGEWDGRGSLPVFVTLEVGNRLVRRIPPLLRSNPEKGFSAFIGVFGKSIRQQIAKLYAHQADRDEVFQTIWLELWEEHPKEEKRDGPCWRLKSFEEPGSFVAFVRVIVDRLLTDILRGQIGRLRLPACVAKLPKLEQAIFQALFWERVAPDATALTAVIGSRVPGATPNSVAAAYRNLRDHIPVRLPIPRPADVSIDAPVDAGDGAGAAAREIVDPHRTPAQALEDKERNGLMISAAAAALRFLETLPEDQRAYFEEEMRGTKRQNMPWPTKKVDQLRRSVRTAFERFKSTDEAVFKWRAYDQEDSGAAR